MSIVYNGTTLATTDGTIKYGTTNVQKITYNGTSVWEVPQSYTITWTSALSKYGSFINSTSPTSSTKSNYGGKQIKYTKPDGTTAVANPYQAGSITIQKGTTVYLEMFAGISSSSYSDVEWYVGGSGVGRDYRYNGDLCSYGYTPKGPGTLALRDDRRYNNGDGYRYFWYVNITY